MAFIRCIKFFLLCMALAVAAAYGSPKLPVFTTSGAALPSHGGVQIEFKMFRPADAQKRAPLLVLVAKKQSEPNQFRYKSSFVASIETLNHHGIAVAYLGITPGYVPDSEVADLVGGLIQDAFKLGFDAQRVYLLGMEYGARFVGRQLFETGFAAIAKIAGIVLLGPDSALYELVKAAKAISPLPPILILVGEHQPRFITVSAYKLSRKLRASAVKETFQILPQTTGSSIFNFDMPSNTGIKFLLHFMGLGNLAKKLTILKKLEREWYDPPWRSDLFHLPGLTVETYTAEMKFQRQLEQFFWGETFRLAAWPLVSYHGIPLARYLRSRFGDLRDKFLVTTNVRGEQLVWNLNQMLDFDPIIVTGLDDESNLFRLNVFYQPLRETSWAPVGLGPPIMTRSLGAFLFFRGKEPRNLMPRYLAQFSLLPEGFVLHARDPLAPFRSLDAELLAALTHENGCIACHSWRGVGGAAHHISAQTRVAHGGYALPLERYEEKVLRRFIFQQGEVAALIGASPNRFGKRVAQKLYDLFRTPER